MELLKKLVDKCTPVLVVCGLVGVASFVDWQTNTAQELAMTHNRSWFMQQICPQTFLAWDKKRVFKPIPQMYLPVPYDRCLEEMKQNNDE